MTDLNVELSIVMPCLNEAETLATCIRKAQRYLDRSGVRGEIVIGDNGSTDGSQEIATNLGACVIHIPVRGYGAALYGAINAACGAYCIMGDSDDSYDFQELDNFVQKLREGYDLVMGNRFKGGIQKEAMPWKNRYIGNPVLSAIGRMLFHAKVGDFHCGIRGISRDAFQQMNLRSTGMEFASEMVIKATLLKLRVTEVPTTLSPDGRTRAPHLLPYRDGWRHLRLLLLYSPRWLFLYPGLAASVVGFLFSVWLLPSQRAIGRIYLDVDSLTYTLGLMLIGVHMCVFAVSAKVFGTREGFLPPNPQFERLFEYVTLEKGLLVGVALLLAGFGTAVYSIELWRQVGFGALTPTHILRLTLPSAALMMLGVEVVFSSFFLTLLGMSRR